MGDFASGSQRKSRGSGPSFRTAWRGRGCLSFGNTHSLCFDDWPVETSEQGRLCCANKPQHLSGLPPTHLFLLMDSPRGPGVSLSGPSPRGTQRPTMISRSTLRLLYLSCADGSSLENTPAPASILAWCSFCSQAQACGQTQLCPPVFLEHTASLLLLPCVRRHVSTVSVMSQFRL